MGAPRHVDGLSAHVFACAHGRYTVFLDLRGDRYFAVETANAAPVLQRFEGRVRGAGRIERPKEDLTDVGLNDPLPLRGCDVARFIAATIAAWTAFKCLPLDRLVRRVSRRRGKRGPHVGPFDPARAKRCAAVYERLRPLAFTARDACLFESLAFIEFAARCGLYPLWVFGVQATPFAAHCWVQHGSLVLNDSAEHAAAYAPIMAA